MIALHTEERSISAADYEALLARLQRAFRGQFNDQDCEDFAQETLVKYLMTEPKNLPVEGKLLAWLTTIGLQVGVDRWRRERVAPAATVDPSAPSYVQAGDARVDLLAQLADRELVGGLIEVIDGLGPLAKQVYVASLDDGLSVKEACRAFGISKATYHRELTLVSEALGDVVYEGRPLSEAQRSFLRVCALGTANVRQRTRLRRLVAKSPEASALYEDLRRVNRGAALLLPPSATAGSGGVLAALASAGGAVKAKLFGGEVVSQAASGGASSSATAGGGGGVLAAVGGSKVAALCAGGAAVCGVGGIVVAERAIHDAGKPAKVAEAAPKPKPKAPPALVQRVVAPVPKVVDEITPAAVVATDGGGHSDGGGSDGGASADSTAPAAEPISEPAAATQEFDPLTSPAAPAPAPAPAPASSDTSGSTSSGGGSATAAGTEFGP